MERLTIWDVPGEIAVPWDNRNSCDDICKEVGGECERCIVNECFKKLAEYEDTGYTPDKIEKMDHEIYNLRNIVTYEYEKDYSSYEEAEEAKQKELGVDNGREDQADR